MYAILISMVIFYMHFSSDIHHERTRPIVAAPTFLYFLYILGFNLTQKIFGEYATLY